MDYTLKGKTYTLDADDQKVCVDHPPKVKEDWSKDKYEPYKQKLKKAYYLGQYDRCAYCRGIIEGDAYYEPLDHIIAKAARPDWLLEPKNLIVTCDRCNNRKGTEPTVTAEALAGAKFPDDEKDYLIFNPHFDNWADHLQFEEDIFIT
ncbi:MAG: HNH endonuclease signature motif containing protein, partial [Bacteroidota bacterium]